MEYIKNDGENSILRLTYKNCKHLDGKCFIDLDRPNYLEVIKFIITEDEIQCRYTGTNGIKGVQLSPMEKPAQTIRPTLSRVDGLICQKNYVSIQIDTANSISFTLFLSS